METVRHDEEVMMIETPQELAMLAMYREGSEQEKQRMRKVLRAAVQGLLPSADQIERMTGAQRETLIDSLPDAA